MDHESREKQDVATGRAEERGVIGCATLVFGIVALLAGTIGAMGQAALFTFLGIASLYLMIVKAGIFNALEGAVICFILLLLSLLLVDGILKVHAREWQAQAFWHAGQ